MHTLCLLLCSWHHRQSSMFVCLQNDDTKVTLQRLPTLQNNETVPQVLKQVVNLSCFNSFRFILSPTGQPPWRTGLCLFGWAYPVGLRTPWKDWLVKSLGTNRKIFMILQLIILKIFWGREMKVIGKKDQVGQLSKYE